MDQNSNKHCNVTEDVLKDIITVAAHLGIPVMELRRDNYRACKNVPVSTDSLKPWRVVLAQAAAYANPGQSIEEQSVDDDECPAPDGVNLNDVENGTATERTFNRDGSIKVKGFLPPWLDLCDADAVLRFNKFDPDKWHLIKLDIKKYQVAAKIDGKLQEKELTSFNLVVSPRTVVTASSKIIEGMFALAEKKLNNYFPPPEARSTRDGENRMLLISITDLHFGRVCCNKLGAGEYNVDISRKMFKDAVSHLITLADKSGFNQILLPIGNDFYNVDNMNIATTAGTRQDQGTSWQQMYSEGFDLLMEVIEALAKDVAPVDVITVPGNHDKHSSYTLGYALHSYFKRIKHVRVHAESRSVKYYKYGNNLLGFAHGKEETPNKLVARMPMEMREIWSQILFRVFYVGHYHHRKQLLVKLMEEDAGIVVQFLASLAPGDAWHVERGYLGQLQCAEAFLWNYKWGQENQFTAPAQTSILPKTLHNLMYSATDEANRITV